jgi:hypothetical protein
MMDAPAGYRRSFALPTEAVLRVAVWCALLVVLSFTSADPDLWGHVRFGRDILRDGNVHQTDTYSFASDRPWVNHEWGAEVLSALAFNIAGNPGLVVLKLLILGPVLLLLDAELRKEGVRSAFARDLTAGAAIIVTLSQAHHVRPQLFSLLLFSILLSCLLNARRGSLRYLYVLPPMFAVWANLHGGWIVGGGVVALWAFSLLITNQRKLAFACVAAGALSLLATLATPYGPVLWQFLHETIGFSRPEILEWQPVYVTGWPFVVLWAIALAIMVGGAFLERRGEVRLERLVVGIALAAASFKVARLLAFFGLASVFLFAPAIGRAYQRRRAERARGANRVLRVGVLVLGSAVGLFAGAVVRDNFWQLRLDTMSMPEPQAVALLADQPTGKRVLVWFNWGEYAIWHLPPRMQVSIDGRRETVYSDDLQTRHFDFFFDRPGGATLPNDLAVDYIWIPTILPAAHRLHTDPHWNSIYEGVQSVIFARAGSGASNRTPPIAAATTVPRFFPGP